MREAVLVGALRLIPLDRIKPEREGEDDVVPECESPRSEADAVPL